MTLQTDSNAIRLPEKGTDEMSCQRFKFLHADLMRGIVMQQILHVSTSVRVFVERIGYGIVQWTTA